jgi:type IV pilus assembly protein PilW
MNTAPRLPRLEAGLSLVELLVALTIGSLIIVGTVLVYSQSRNNYALNESTARLQEEARYVLSLIEPDLQLAGFYGFTNASDDFLIVDGTGSGVPTSKLQQSDPRFSGLAAATHACGDNFALDLMATVQGLNNIPNDGAFSPGPNADAPGPTSRCARNSIAPGTDSLTIRRASTDPVGASALRLQLYVNRLKQTNQRIMLDGVAPGPLNAGLQEIRNLVVRTFYVAGDSEGRPGTPSLRMIALGDGQTFSDIEIMPGVEDLQVQFGIDTGDYDNDGAIDVDADANGIPDAPNGFATRYVNANSPLLPGAQVVSVRLWLRLRAEQREVGFVDGRAYNYADTSFTPTGADAGFRRVVVSRTIQLRNARTL